MPHNQPHGRILGEIVVSPPALKLGETVSVKALRPNGQRFDDVQIPLIRINGVTGANQFLQFARSGKQHILVTAEQDGRVERRRVEIKVKSWMEQILGTPQPALGRTEKKKLRKAIAGMPLLQIGKYANDPYRVAFAVGGYRVFPDGLANGKLFHKKGLESDLQAHVDTHRRCALAGSGAQPVTTTSLSAGTVPESLRLSMRPVNTLNRRLRKLPADAKLLTAKGRGIQGAIRINPSFAAASLQPSPASSAGNKRYHWDFGDGTVESTSSSCMEHDYQPALDPDHDYQSFQVSLRIQKPTGSVDEVKRTLTVYNAYALCKKGGTLVPRVEQKIFADVEGFGFRAKLRVHNVENVALLLTAQRIRIVSMNALHADILSTPVSVSLTIPVKGTREISLFVTFSMVPKKSMGFTVYYFGNAPDGNAIRVEAFFDVRAREQPSGTVARSVYTMMSLAGGCFEYQRYHYQPGSTMTHP